MTLFEPPPVLSERQWQDALQDALTREGYRWSFTRPLLSNKGRWMTGCARGWPDLYAIRPPWTLVIEAKSNDGRASPDQLAWLELFAACPQTCVWLLRPRDNWVSVANWIARPWEAPGIHGWAPAGS